MATLCKVRNESCRRHGWFAKPIASECTSSVRSVAVHNAAEPSLCGPSDDAPAWPTGLVERKVIEVVLHQVGRQMPGRAGLAAASASLIVAAAVCDFCGHQRGLVRHDRLDGRTTRLRYVNEGV